MPLEIEALSQNDKYNEFVMTGLRTSWGISLKTISSRFGDHYKDFLLNQAQFYITKHLLYIDNDSLKATKKGKFLTDGIASELFMLN